MPIRPPSTAHDSRTDPHLPPPLTSPTMRAPLAALALAAFPAGASALPAPFATPLTDRAPRRHLARAPAPGRPHHGRRRRVHLQRHQGRRRQRRVVLRQRLRDCKVVGSILRARGGRTRARRRRRRGGPSRARASRGSPAGPTPRETPGRRRVLLRLLRRGARSGRRGLRLRRGRRRARRCPSAGAGTVRRVKFVNEPRKRRADH